MGVCLERRLVLELDAPEEPGGRRGVALDDADHPVEERAEDLRAIRTSSV